MHRLLALTALLPTLVFAGGCVFPYCAYPTLAYTPNLKLETPTREVHAFRVDITKPTADLSVFVGPVYEALSEVPATNVDEIPAQIKPSLSYGLVVIGVALNFLTHTSHSMALRLYRPGYELVEVKSWERVSRVAWKLAQDLEAQEKTLDALLPIRRLYPGSESDAHKEALLFGAVEYERLAATARSEDQRDRLAKKAGELRKRASDKQ
jgi:hypothetical protein